MPNFNCYGVFPLRGKLLNVREASHKQIMENAEIQSIKQILGLQHGKQYDSVKTLRYGHLMIMTDQIYAVICDPSGPLYFCSQGYAYGFGVSAMLANLMGQRDTFIGTYNYMSVSGVIVLVFAAEFSWSSYLGTQGTFDSLLIEYESSHKADSECFLSFFSCIWNAEIMGVSFGMAANIVSSSIQPLQNIGVLKYIGEKVHLDEKLVWVQYHIGKGFAALEKLLKDYAGKYATGDEVCLMGQRGWSSEGGGTGGNNGMGDGIGYCLANEIGEVVGGDSVWLDSKMDGFEICVCLVKDTKGKDLFG
ncbi:unnamed protein product [Camellia sinensis]